MCAVKSTIPDNISEEYYQINPEILSSFSKYRPPVDLFRFKEDILQLLPYSRKGQRLSNEQVEEINKLCEDGDLFVSRSDHPVYSKHIIKQLDLVLVDKNLKEAEITDIFVQAFQMRIGNFFDQTVPVVYELLYNDIMVLTQYLSEDRYRVRSLLRRLVTGEHTLINHSVNCGIVGLWLYLKNVGDEFRRRDLDRHALAFFLHDMGMSKIANFILTKTVPLTPEERSKVNAHVGTGANMADKLGLTFDEMTQAIMEHHERMDGSGYPNKLVGDEISKTGRMCAVVDAFCAMVTQRPYADAMEPVDAAQNLAEDEKHFDGRFSKLLYSAYMSGQF